MVSFPVCSGAVECAADGGPRREGRARRSRFNNRGRLAHNSAAIVKARAASLVLHGRWAVALDGYAFTNFVRTGPSNSHVNDCGKPPGVLVRTWRTGPL